MNRILVLLLAVLILGGVAWYFYEPEETLNTSLGADRRFKIETPEQIGKIFIADRKGNQTTLERSGDHWIYNGEYRAKSSAMGSLLDAITRIEMMYQPSSKLEKTMVKDLSTSGIKVEIFDLAGNLMKAYYVGGGTADERGTYMILENANQPYVVHIPSWEGNVRFRYNLTGDDWRDKSLFQDPLSDPAYFAVHYPKQRKYSFKMSRTESGTYEVAPYYSTTPTSKRPYRVGSGRSYLRAIEELSAEGFQNRHKDRDSLSQILPFAVIEYATTPGDTNSIKLIPITTKPVVDTKTNKFLGSPSVERFHIVQSQGDFMIGQNRVLEPVFRSYDYFFE